MNPEQAERYAELVAELGGLLAAAHGEGALDSDRLDLVREDVAGAVNDALPTAAF